MRKYYIVVAMSKVSGQYQFAAGHADKGDAQAVCDDFKTGRYGSGHTDWHIVEVDSDSQADIEAKLAELNKQ